MKCFLHGEFLRNPAEGLTKTGDCLTTKTLSTGEKVHLWGLKKPRRMVNTKVGQKKLSNCFVTKNSGMK